MIEDRKVENHNTRMSEDAEGHFLPDKCTVCTTKLNKGVAFFVYMCHEHAVCYKGDHSEDISPTWCPFCDKKEPQTSERNISTFTNQRPLTLQPRSLECDRNYLDAIPMASSKGISPASSSCLYEYPLLHPISSVESLTYGRALDTGDDRPYTCWSAGDRDTIIAGGRNEHDQPTLTVISSTGEFVTRVLSCGRSIVSGLLVKKCLHIVCVGYGNWRVTSGNRIYLVNLDPASDDPSTTINPHFAINVQNPVYVFRKSTQLCGVLCMDKNPFSNGRIRLLGLDQLILARETDFTSIQSTAIWGRRTVPHLDLPDVYPRDTVAVTPRGHYCIASFLRGEIRVYYGTGVYMFTIGEEQLGSLDPGKLFYPVAIQCTAENIMVITGHHGNVQLYNLHSETGTLVKTWYPWVDQQDRNDDNEYNSDGTRNVYYIKNDPTAWRILRHDLREGFVVDNSVITCTQVWDITKEMAEYRGRKIHVYKSQ